MNDIIRCKVTLLKAFRFFSVNSCVMFLALLALGISPKTFSNNIVQETVLSWSSGRGALAIQFNYPINVLAMSPRSQGQLLTLDLQLMNQNVNDEMFKPQWLGRNQQNSEQLYEYIRLERTSNNRASLEIKFQKVANFRVQRTRDSKKLVISTDIPANAQVAGNGIIEPTPSNASINRASDPISLAATEALMEQAKRSMISLNYGSAAQSYQQVVEQGAAEYGPRALEFLGVALEKQGKNQEAQQAYSQFLDRYPSDDGVPRVKQRLAGVRSLNEEPNEQRREVKDVADQNDSKWKFFGTFSEFYRYSSVSVDDEDSDVRESAFFTDGDINAMYRTDRWDIKARFSGGLITDVSGDTDDDGIDGIGFDDSAVEEKDTRVSHFYADLANRTSGYSVRLGRQHSAKGGVLGTFDGVNAQLGVNDWLKINGVAGFQADSPYDTTIESDYYFFGAGADIIPSDWGLAMSAYFLIQSFNEIDDRQVIGGELRYQRNNLSLFSLIDYDLLFEELNAFTLISSWTAPTQTQFTFSVDQRRSPALARRNATIGQDENLTVFDLINGGASEDDVQALALDNTSENSVITFSVSHPFAKRFQLISDLTLTSFTAGDNLVEDDPLGNTGDQTSLGTQLIVSRLISDRDVNTFGFRYIDQENFQIFRTSYDGKFSFQSVRGLTVRPGFDFDVRTDGGENTGQEEISQFIFVPSIRADMTFLKRHHVEVELGLELISRDFEDEDETQDENGFFGAIGYWLDI